MNRCCGVMRSRASLLQRAVRTAFGVLLIGVFTGYCLRYLHNDPQLMSIGSLQLELGKLKTVCLRDVSRSQVMRRPCMKKSSGCAQVSEDDIRATVKAELSTYGYDITGKADFALEKLGACVVTTRKTKEVAVAADSYFGVFKEKSNPNEILRPSLTPGSCWAFDGSSGTVVIQLVGSVLVDGISLEHISPLMTPSGEISSAPKTFTLWGLDSVDTVNRHKFGTFEYEIVGPSVQTFGVQMLSSRPYRLVEVSFHDNHGNQNYTCVYRVRIHGKIG